MKAVKRASLGAVVVLVAVMLYLWGHSDGHAGRAVGLTGMAAAAESSPAPSDWSPTQPSPSHDVYYPGTEELRPDEMRVIACGTGMPMPRLKQAAACFLIELGNGDKFTGKTR